MAPNLRFTYTPSVLTNVSVEAKIVYRSRAAGNNVTWPIYIHSLIKGFVDNHLHN